MRAAPSVSSSYSWREHRNDKCNGARARQRAHGFLLATVNASFALVYVPDHAPCMQATPRRLFAPVFTAAVAVACWHAPRHPFLAGCQMMLSERCAPMAAAMLLLLLGATLERAQKRPPPDSAVRSSVCTV